ncbi:hypothetical protein KA005_37350 [bacterium]|nr:hypothetical protein [bacterium]
MNDTNDIRPEKVRFVSEPELDTGKKFCKRHHEYYYGTMCHTCLKEEQLKQLIVLRKKVDLLVFNGNLAPTDSGKPSKTLEFLGD